MFYQFQYESEYYPTLSRVPLHVRMKLDITGINISLKDWLSFSFAERTVLCHLPIGSEDERRAFSSYLDFLSRNYRGEPAPLTEPAVSALWDSLDRPPQPVIDKLRETTHPITPGEWSGWKSYQRYALYKTATSKSETEAFFAVLRELRAGKS